jgi:hypothetical protein
VIAVRLVGPGGVVRESLFRAGPVVIGRDEECDFPILDPSVSRRHVRILADGEGAVFVEDLGSRNGLFAGTQRVERAALATGSATRLRLGAVEVEIALGSADDTLEMAAPRPAESAAATAGRVGLFWLLGVAAGLALLLIEPGFWSPWQMDRASNLASAALGLGVGLPVAAFVLVGLLRVAGRRLGIGEALRALALVSLGFVLLSLLESATYYVLSVRAHSVLSTILTGLGLVATISYLASLARPGPKRRFVAMWATAVALLLIAFGAAGSIASRQAGAARVDPDVRVPIAGQVGPSTELGPFLEGVLDDFETAQQAAENERRQLEASGP